jgi:peptide/nickel transport system ATP-binding protein
VKAFCDDMLVLYSGSAVEQASQAVFAGPVRHPYTRLLTDSVPEMDRQWLARRAAVERPALPGAALDKAGVSALCRFLPRCHHAVAGTCDVAPPPLRLGEGQAVLCHLSLDDLASAGVASIPRAGAPSGVTQ